MGWYPGANDSVSGTQLDQALQGLMPDGRLPAQGGGFHPGMPEGLASKLFSWGAVRVQA
jgi:hypothetical protein